MKVNKTEKEEKQEFMNMAIGRLFSIMSRPYRTGDDEEYEKIKRVVMELNKEL